MFPIDTFRTTLEKIIAILQQLDVKFHLTGGVTSVALGCIFPLHRSLTLLQPNSYGSAREVIKAAAISVNL
jgi:hypothetical protein